MSDNLTHIKDIGLAREKWLNEHGIATYADLAKVDPHWLCDQLKTEGKPSVPLEVILGWIGEAISLSASLLASSESDNTITKDGWEEFASFYVSYQHQHQHQVQHSPLRTRVVYRTLYD